MTDYPELYPETLFIKLHRGYHKADHSWAWPSFNGRTAQLYVRKYTTAQCDRNGLPSWQETKKRLAEKLPHYVILDPDRYTCARFQHWNDGEDRFSQLPNEIQQHVFSFLPGRAILRMVQVNRHFNAFFSPRELFAAGRDYFRFMTQAKNLVIKEAQREIEGAMEELEKKDKEIKDLKYERAVRFL